MSSNFERKARRKRQAKLTFDPIIPSDEPSSSAFYGSSPAKVRYELPKANGASRTPVSSSMLDGDEIDSEDPLTSIKSAKQKSARKSGGGELFKVLPTPAKSSQQAQGNLYGNDDEVDEAGKSNPFQSATKARFGSRNKASIASKTFKGAGYDSSDGSSEEELETPSKRVTNPSASKLPARKPTRRQKSITLSDSEDEPTLSTPRSISKILSTSSKRPVFEIPSARKEVIELDSDPGSDSDEIITTSQPERLQRPVAPTTFEEDSDEEPLTSPLKRRRAVAQDSDEEPLTSPLKRIRAAVKSSDSDSDIASSPLKRRRPTVVIEEGDDEEEEDENSDSSLPLLSNITSSKTSTSRQSPLPSRNTRQQKSPKKHRTEKQKTLELMKRKRAGEKIDKLTDTESDSDEEARGGIYDTDDELEVLDEFDDEEEDIVEHTSNSKTKRAKSKTKPHKKDDNEYDSDFVVDEDDGPLGVPDIGLADIPLQFTHAAHKPLKEHFKDAIEWLVQNKINPGFNRDDPVYRQAFLKLNDEVAGLAKSKFTSTQWTHEFTRTIYARPQFLERPLAEGEGFDVDGVPKCDTCNHRKHVPSFAIQFKGKAYDKDTLEEFEEDSDDEDDHSVDENGQELPEEDKEWFSGRICRDNAQHAHTLIHWKHALNTWVVEMLEESGELEPAKLAVRLKMKSKQRREDANSVVDSWEAEGHIKGLYRDFKIILDTARNASTGGRWGK